MGRKCDSHTSTETTYPTYQDKLNAESSMALELSSVKSGIKEICEVLCNIVPLFSIKYFVVLKTL